MKAAFRAIYVLGLLLVTVGCSGQDDGGTQRGALRYPVSLDFGRVPVGVGRVLRFSMENVGSRSVRVDGFRVEIDEIARIEVEPRQLTILPGAAAELRVRLDPVDTSDEPRSISLVFDTDIPGEGTDTILVQARGVRDGLVLSPSDLNFGRVVRGRTSTRTVVIRSILPEAIELDIDVEEGTRTGRFSVLDATTLAGPLLPGESASVVVGYTPARTGESETERGTAVVRFCPRSVCEREVPMFGEAVNNPLRCEPSPIDFGSVRADRRRTSFTECVNTGQRDVRVLGARLASSSDPMFVAQERTQAILSPGRSTTIGVSLDVPTEAADGYRSATMIVEAEDARDGAGFPDLEVNVTVQVGGPAVAVSPAAVDFGRVAVGTEGTALFILENAGEGLLEVNELEFEGPFSLASPEGPIQLARGESTVLRLAYSPVADGHSEGQLTVRTDAVENADLKVPLRGLGLVLQPCAARWEPSSLDFGEVPQFRTSTRGLQLRNVGEHLCLIREGAVGSHPDDAFELVQGGGVDVLLEPGEAWTFVVGFRPARSALVTGSVRVLVSDPSSPLVSVPTRGAGNESTLVLSPDEIYFGELRHGCGASESLRVYNPGTSTVRLESARLVGEGSASPFSLRGPASLLDGTGYDLRPDGSVELLVGFVPEVNGGRTVGRIEVELEGSRFPLVVSLFGKSSVDPMIEERWEQAALRSVDILVVIDRSFAMEAELDLLQTSFPRLLRYAEAQNLDYRIAVISSDMEGGGRCDEATREPPTGIPPGSCGFFSEGEPSDSSSELRIIDSGDQPSPEAGLRRISAFRLGGFTQSSGLLAAVRALEPSRLLGWNSGFLARKDAFLGVVFVSDRDDRSPPTGRLGQLVMYEAVLAAIKGARFRDRYALSGLVPDSDVCGAAGRPRAHRYVAAIQRSGGALGSICASNYDNEMDRIARAATGFRDRFVMRQPAFAPSISVQVDRVPQAEASNGLRRWRFDGPANAVVFEPAFVPRAGSEVVVGYRPVCIPAP